MSVIYSVSMYVYKQNVLCLKFFMEKKIRRLGETIAA